jgi:hypothetical protein
MTKYFYHRVSLRCISEWLKKNGSIPKVYSIQNHEQTQLIASGIDSTSASAISAGSNFDKNFVIVH